MSSSPHGPRVSPVRRLAVGRTRGRAPCAPRGARRAARAVGASLLAWALGTNVAWAQAAAPSRVALELAWDASVEGCPDAASVRGDLEGLLDRAEADATAPIAVAVRVAPLGRARTSTAGLLARVTLGPPIAATRAVRGSTCAEVVRAAVLVVAVAVDPRALERAEPATPAPTTPAAPPAVGSSPATPTPAADPSASPAPGGPPAAQAPVAAAEPVRRVAWVLELGVLGAARVLPEPSGGVAVGVLWRPADPWGVRLGVEALWPRERVGLAGGSVGVEVGDVGGVLEAGPRLVLGSGVAVGATAGIVARVLIGRGVGSARVTTRPGLLVGPRLGATLTVDLGSGVHVVTGSALTAAVHRPEFVVEHAGTAYRPPRLGVDGSLGLGVRLR